MLCNFKVRAEHLWVRFSHKGANSRQRPNIPAQLHHEQTSS